MKPATAILLVGAGLAVAMVVVLRRKEETKPTGWAAAAPAIIDLAKWGYGEFFDKDDDEKGGEDDA